MLAFSIVFLFLTTTVIAADKPPDATCEPRIDICTPKDGVNYSCQPGPPDAAGKRNYTCQVDVFGQIETHPAIKNLLGKDQTGAAGISQFLSNFIKLIYTVSAIALVFMLLWGAFDWIISEGNKEKLQAAQQKIIAAVIGILLLAVAFAIIQVLGAFTGFTFFAGQRGVPSPTP